MSIVLFGANGYGKTYLSLIENYIGMDKLSAVVDPFANKSDYSVPVFDNAKDFFESGINAKLAIISTPIYCHIQQSKACIDKGLTVLCEKPITALYEDALQLQEYVNKNNAKLGVGFQWSFSKGILALKNDIANGIYGNPKLFKCFMSWQRNKDYYGKSDWKGRIENKNGMIYDNIISNATAHYLHNIFFVANSEPKSYSYVTARANDIETFDACIIKGVLKNGADFYYSAIHCGEEYIEPTFEFHFEKGTVFYNQNIEDRLYAIMNNGEIIEYGSMQGDEVTAQKIKTMLAVSEGNANIPCKIENVLPHLKTCNEIVSGKQPFVFKNTMVNNNIVVVNGLSKKQKQWYEELILPEYDDLAML